MFIIASLFLDTLAPGYVVLRGQSLHLVSYCMSYKVLTDSPKIYILSKCILNFNPNSFRPYGWRTISKHHLIWMGNLLKRHEADLSSVPVYYQELWTENHPLWPGYHIIPSVGIEVYSWSSMCYQRNFSSRSKIIPESASRRTPTLTNTQLEYISAQSVNYVSVSSFSFSFRDGYF